MRSAVLDRRSHIAIRVPGVLLRLWCTRAGLCPRYKVLLELESLFPNPFSILTLILLIIRPPESTREERRVANAYPHNTRGLVHAVYVCARVWVALSIMYITFVKAFCLHTSVAG